MSRGLGGVINQAHLIHDQSAGRSSTRLHAPPGGHSSMGSGFSWGPEDPAPAPRGRAQVQAQQTTQTGSSVYSGGGAYQSNQGYAREHALQSPYAPQLSSAQYAAETGLQKGVASPPSKGFGDSGRACIRLDSANRTNAMGNGFGWEDQSHAPRSSQATHEDAYARHLQSQGDAGTPPHTTASLSLSVGAMVIYKQIGKAGIESQAVIVDILPAASRKDNYRIQFQDGSERNTTQNCLRVA